MLVLPEFAVSILAAWADVQMGRAPDQELGRDTIYLRRWYVHRDPDGAGNIYIHEMLRSDEDPELHDHPWENASILLRRKMREVTMSGTRLLVPGSVVLRAAQDRHRIEIDKPTVSLFLTGPRARTWGFWHDEPLGFVPSQEHFKMRGYT